MCRYSAFHLLRGAVDPAKAHRFFDCIDVPESSVVHRASALYNHPAFVLSVMIFQKPLSQLISIARWQQILTFHFLHPHNVRFADLFALIVSQNAAEHKNRNRGLNCGSCSWSYGCSAGIEWFRAFPDRSVCGQAASRPCSTRKFRATSFTSRPSTSTW